ncbi:hypothetical protein [Capnocytophaga canis]|uniref:hypothetical protein n=1 Tax=Capnocytophaga canis TaxID=1848903 RepID=UPI0037D36DCB
MRKYISIVAIITFLFCVCASIYYAMERDYSRANYHLLLAVFNYLIAINNKE